MCLYFCDFVDLMKKNFKISKTNKFFEPKNELEFFAGVGEKHCVWEKNRSCVAIPMPRQNNMIKINLQKQVARLVEQIGVYEEALSKIQPHNHTDLPLCIQDYFELHLEQHERNKKLACPSYPAILRPFYVILSFVGESNYNLLSYPCGLPFFRTVQNYRNEMLSAYELTESAFDGSEDSIRNLKKIMWGEKEVEDNRCVLAIDAASLNPQVRISEKGEITGFTADGPKTVEPEYAYILREDAKEYKKFIIENKNYVSQYEFVVLLIPLDPTLRAFPICITQTHSGAATTSIKDNLIELQKKCDSLGFNIVGFAFDGDKQYLDLSDDVILENNHPGEAQNDVLRQVFAPHNSSNRKTFDLESNTKRFVCNSLILREVL